jgi:hypothetical protein
MAQTKVDLAKIYGKIQYVTNFPDYNVQIVDSFPDLKVQVVTSFPDRAGKWQIVDSLPDFKIQLVTSHPDFKIKLVGSFPGLAETDGLMAPSLTAAALMFIVRRRERLRRISLDIQDSDVG